VRFIQHVAGNIGKPVPENCNIASLTPIWDLYGRCLGSVFLGAVSGDMVMEGFRDSGQNHDILKAGIADCESKHPRAWNSWSHINSIAAETW